MELEFGRLRVVGLVGGVYLPGPCSQYLGRQAAPVGRPRRDVTEFWQGGLDQGGRPGRSNLPVTLDASLGDDRSAASSRLPNAEGCRGFHPIPGGHACGAKAETLTQAGRPRRPVNRFSWCSPIVACFWRRQSEDGIDSSRAVQQGPLRMPTSSFPPPVTARSACSFCRPITSPERALFWFCLFENMADCLLACAVCTPRRVPLEVVAKVVFWVR